MFRRALTAIEKHNLLKIINRRLVVLVICVLTATSLVVPLARVNGTLSTTGPSSVATFTVFDGLNEANSGYAAPPDPQVAAGPSHVVEMVNRQVAMYNKQGVLLLSKPFSSFFKTGVGDIYDPKILFDAMSGRWFATLADGADGTVRLAVSATSDPTANSGNWTVYSVNKPKTNCPDNPRLGVSSDKVVVTADQFAYLTPNQPDVACFGGGVFGPQYWVLSKADLLNGLASTHNITIGPSHAFLGATLSPVKTLTQTGTLYMIVNNESSPAPSSFQIITLDGAPPKKVTNATFTIKYPSVMQALPANGSPEPPINGGSTFYLDTVSAGTSIQDAAWTNGKLWFAFNIGCTPLNDNRTRTCIHFEKVDTGTMSILQDFDYGTRNLYQFYPSLSVDGNGNLDVIYGISNSTTYPSLAITGQGINDPTGSLAPAVTIKAGSSTWTLSRWGDYFGAGLDPSDTTLVWVNGEYVGQNSQIWNTFVASMRVLPLYTMTTSPPTLQFVCDSTGCDPSQASTLTIKSMNGFSGTLTFTYIPPGISGNTSLSGPSTAVVPAGGSTNITITATPAGVRGTFTWTIQGSFNGYSTSTTLKIQVATCRPGLC